MMGRELSSSARESAETICPGMRPEAAPSRPTAIAAGAQSAARPLPLSISHSSPCFSLSVARESGRERRPAGRSACARAGKEKVNAPASIIEIGH